MLVRLVTGLSLALLIVGSAGGGAAARGELASGPALVLERGGDLYATTIDGSRITRLTRTKACECSAAISFDQTRLAYSDHGLWTMRLDGGGRKRLTRNATDNRPAWSPDGRTIYFDRNIPAQVGPDCSGLFRIGLDGRGVSALAG